MIGSDTDSTAAEKSQSVLGGPPFQDKGPFSQFPLREGKKFHGGRQADIDRKADGDTGKDNCGLPAEVGRRPDRALFFALLSPDTAASLRY